LIPEHVKALGGCTVIPVQPKLQYLIWALELIEEVSNQKAADHNRLALEALRNSDHRSAHHASDQVE
jgi:hypothetical protein